MAYDSTLFSPLKLAGITFPNRIVRLAHVRILL